MTDARTIEEVGGKWRGADKEMECYREEEGGFGGDAVYGLIRRFRKEKGYGNKGCGAVHMQRRLPKKMSAYVFLHRHQGYQFHHTSAPTILAPQLKHLFLKTTIQKPTRPKATTTLTPSCTERHGRYVTA